MSAVSKPHSDLIEQVRIYLTWVPPDHAAAATRAIDRLEEQYEALEGAARRILTAPKGTSHRQMRFWLMDALGGSYPATSRCDKCKHDAHFLPFAIYCDENGLTLMQGHELAEQIGEALAYAAEDRRDNLPPELLDDEGDDSFQEGRPNGA